KSDTFGNRGPNRMNELSKNAHVHVIDVDFRQRAQISSALVSRNLHTEIYEDPAEFLGNLPSFGSVLINEDPERDNLEEFFGQVRGQGRFYPVSVYSQAPEPQQIVRAIRN